MLKISKGEESKTVYLHMKNDALIGKRVRLIKMEDGQPVEPGTEGVIQLVDGIGQLHVKWDNGRTLALIPEVDEFVIELE